jgi:hypothetical protein
MPISTIQQPITENYIYQTMITMLSNDKSLTINGVNFDSEFFLRYSNSNYENLENNGYKYVFVYDFDLASFVRGSRTDIENCKIISHDQIHINFGASLSMFSYNQPYYETQYVPFKNKARQIQVLKSKDIYTTVTPGYLDTKSSSANTYSQQYSFPYGVSLKQYMDTVIDQLPGLVQACPLKMNTVQDYKPVSYIAEYDYIDLEGNQTKKTATFTAMNYKLNNGEKRVLFFGTGLQEFLVPPPQVK